MSNSLLLGSEAFKTRLESAAKSATSSFYVQAMTFEGDAAGMWLLEVMRSSPAKDKCLLVDCYSKVVINDHFVVSPKYVLDSKFRREVKKTNQILEEAQQEGIQVVHTNPVGFFGQKYPLRNHKKLVLLDEKISYLGGINFSDHNFSWHDMMIESNEPVLGKILADDVRSTLRGVNQSKKYLLPTGELYLFNGIASKALYEELFDHIRQAQKSIEIVSPYVSDPLLSILNEVSKNKGVDITIVSPEENNKSIFKNLILAEFQKGYFNLKEFEGMSHMKAILIDGEKFVYGSSNYDLVSYYFEQEVVMISLDQDLVSLFKEKVLSQARHVHQPSISSIGIYKANILMKVLNGFGKFAVPTFLKPR